MVQGRMPQTWLEPEDTIENMKWIDEIYEKVRAPVPIRRFYLMHVQSGFGPRPRSKYAYKEECLP
jgi:hypothetical protein